MVSYFSYFHIPNTPTLKPILVFLGLLSGLYLQAQPTAHLVLSLSGFSGTEKVYNVYVSEYRDIIAHSYSMAFDANKMSYQGIRNSIIPSLTNASFGNPSPGVITSLWFEGSLTGGDYVDSTVLYQIVFNVIEPDGSTLCFSQDPLAFEFVDAESNSLDQIIIHDDCFDSLVVIINPTSIVSAVPIPKASIENLHLSNDGQFTFTSLADQHLSFNLYDAQGQILAVLKSTYYSNGRNQGDFHQAIIPGPYLMQTITNGSPAQSLMIIVQ